MGVVEGDGQGRELGAVGCTHDEGAKNVSTVAIWRDGHGDKETVGGIEGHHCHLEGLETSGRDPFPTELSLLLLKQGRKIG